MKRKFTKLMAAFALLVGLTIPMGVWGQTRESETITFAELGLENAVQYTDPFGTNISVTFAGGENDGKYYITGSGIRTYGGGTITITANDNTVTAISTTFSGASYAPASTDVWSCNGTTTNSTSGVNASWSGSATEVVMTRPSGSGHWRMQAITVTYSAGGSQTETYTVTYNANVTGISPIVDTYNEGDNVTLRAANTFTNEGYTFSEWNTQADGDGDAYEAEGTIEDIQDDITLFAIWTEDTPTPSGTTATLNIEAYADANNWENGVKYTTATVSPVTFTANGGGNTGKYYTLGEEWRFYQTESASITISVVEGYTLVSVKPTYNIQNGGVLKNGNSTIASGATVAVSGTSVTFTVDNSGSAANGQVKFTNIDVVYVSDGGTQTASDLTITNQSTDLTFDLYNNTTAQVISYTTSSTGAITITPAESDYFSYVHDAAAKTITVTPTAVTPSAQTVTISQEADDDYYAGEVSFTVSVTNTDPTIPGTLTNPYTVAQAIAVIDDANGETVNGKYATGFVSNIETAYSTQYHNITFDIVDETGNEVFLRAYRCGGDEAADVQVGDSVVVYGNLYYYETGSLYEFAQGCQLVSLVHPASTEPSITITPDVVDLDASQHLTLQLTLTYENLEVENYGSFAVQFYDTNDEPTEKPDWIFSASVTGANDEGYKVTFAVISANEGEARTAYFKVYAYDAENNKIYSNLVTVNQAAPVQIDLRGVTTALVFNAGAFTSSGNGYQSYENVTYTGNNGIDYPGWTLNNVMHSGDNMQMRKDDGEVIIPTILTDYGFTITVTATTNSVFVGVGEDSEENEYTTAETSADVVIKTGSKYAVISTITITPTAPESHTLTINGYSDDNTKTGYYLIASPVTVDPATVEGMTTGDFDLYQFDDTQDKEWLNWKGDQELGYAGHFNLVPGTGYLYAKKATTETQSYTFNLSGTLYDGDGEIDIISGWNLVGNPYAVPAEISMDYYYLTPDVTDLISATASTPIAAMQGVFVNNTNSATSSVIFMEAETGTNNAGESKLALNLTRNRGNLIDRAIVRFGEGGQLPKFQLFENSTKLYIAQGNKDYAIVRSAAQGEMPVSFRASENGTYTLSIETENVEMNYLHLIDNMTGMDVDLLQTPNYTFEAKTSDYASRFRLVFSANGTTDNEAETFAYFNGSSWTVSNLGVATLQVVDVTGRTVSSEQINGNATISLNQTPGVYMFRLVSGNGVKVQKVVVK